MVHCFYFFLVLEGGPYPHKYRVEQFHFHWGKTSQLGAEHLIDGKTYAAEVSALLIMIYASLLYDSRTVLCTGVT